MTQSATAPHLPGAQEIREPAVAGAFYPAAPAALRKQVDELLAAAPDLDLPAPKAIVAPHAGYIYSGALAAQAYARLRPARDRIRRVILLGPAHRVAFQGIAVPTVAAFQTPLGPVRVDREAAAAIADMPQVHQLDAAHALEHSLEVHLPFLQRVLDDVAVLPLVVGPTEPLAVAQVLERLWGGPETAIVISSDLSHYHGYDDARGRDSATASRIEALDFGKIDGHGACGAYPLNGLLLMARHRGLCATRIGLCNSGDTAGDRSRVVGYGAWAFSPCGTREFAVGQRHAMLDLAVRAIRSGLRSGKRPEVRIETFSPPLQTLRACFVTLKKEGRLRGCIGSLAATRPLAADIAWNAWSAAFADPRFPKLTPQELPGLNVGISVLSPPHPLHVADEADLKAKLRPGVDGLIIADGDRRATFLPQVWEDLQDVDTFLAHLKRKAGMAPDHWSDSMQVSRYTAESFAAPVPG
ncbi:AmmeMemoRadiSam system protein B [Marinibaculum pumilum]|uniref:MEMO1 family protein ACFOGJ_06190 n=1 Tax=Marinibaculum pumilum TaxID=1766165 RepID=A0ABV7KWP3_9PROT